MGEGHEVLAFDYRDPFATQTIISSPISVYLNAQSAEVDEIKTAGSLAVILPQRPESLVEGVSVAQLSEQESGDLWPLIVRNGKTLIATDTPHTAVKLIGVQEHLGLGWFAAFEGTALRLYQVPLMSSAVPVWTLVYENLSFFSALPEGEVNAVYCHDGEREHVLLSAYENLILKVFDLEPQSGEITELLAYRPVTEQPIEVLEAQIQATASCDPRLVINQDGVLSYQSLQRQGLTNSGEYSWYRREITQNVERFRYRIANQARKNPDTAVTETLEQSFIVLFRSDEAGFKRDFYLLSLGDGRFSIAVSPIAPDLLGTLAQITALDFVIDDSLRPKIAFIENDRVVRYAHTSHSPFGSEFRRGTARWFVQDIDVINHPRPEVVIASDFNHRASIVYSDQSAGAGQLPRSLFRTHQEAFSFVLPQVSCRDDALLFSSQLLACRDYQSMQSEPELTQGIDLRVSDDETRLLALESLEGQISAVPSIEVAPMDVEFSATPVGGSGIYQYQWDFGDGDSSTEAQPSHIFTAVGVYTVNLTVTDFYNDTQVSGSIEVDARAFMEDITLAPLQPLDVLTGESRTGGEAPMNLQFFPQVSGGSGVYKYRWYVAEVGNTDLPSVNGEGSSLAYIFDQVGAFNVSLSVTDANSPLRSASSTVTITVKEEVRPLRVGGLLTSPPGGPGPLTVNFSIDVEEGTGDYTYQWDFGDGNSSVEAQPVHIYSDVGSYLVSVQIGDANDSSLSASATASVTVLAPIDLTDITVTPVSGVAPLDVRFDLNPSGGSGNYLYLWDFQDGTEDLSQIALQDPQHVFTAAGDYTVLVTVTDATLAEYSVEKEITVQVLPPLSIGGVMATPNTGRAPLAVGFSVNPLGGSGNYTYGWTF
ncbi:MAG TPA: PKD domain-containing protein, partial [Flavobacteriales bacterium]|nr:PKD domain-containing protein [Flavobacteriales bacterium]